MELELEVLLSWKCGAGCIWGRGGDGELDNWLARQPSLLSI